MKQYKSFSQIIILILIGGFLLIGCGNDPYSKGKQAYLMRDYKTAEQHLKKAVQQDARHAKANFYLGRIYYDQKKFQEASRYLQRTLSIDPKIADANFLMGKCYIESGQYRQAYVYFERYLELSPRGKYGNDARDFIENYKNR